MPEHELVYQPEARPGGNRRVAAGLQRGQAAQLIEGSNAERVCRNGRRTPSPAVAVFRG